MQESAFDSKRTQGPNDANTPIHGTLDDAGSRSQVTEVTRLGQTA